MRNLYGQVTVKIMAILSVLLAVSIVGCGIKDVSENDVAVSFPKNYIAEAYSMPENCLAVSSIAVRDDTIYFSVVSDSSGSQTYDVDNAELVRDIRYIDFSEEDTSSVIIPYSVKENNIITQISPNSDGTLDLVMQEYDEIKSSGELDITETFIKKITIDGEELSSYSIMQEIMKQGNVNITDFVTDKKGNAYVIISNILYIWNIDGGLRGVIKIPGPLSRISLSREGMVYLIWMDADGFSLACVNGEGAMLEAGNNLSSNQTYLDMETGIWSDLLLAASDGIYEYNIQTGEEKKIISFSQLDMPAEFGGKLLPLSNNRIAWFQANELTIINGVDEALDSQKRTLILGGTSKSILPWHQEAVANFNKTNQEVRIEIKTYGSDETDGVEELNMAIANGQGPDIMILPRQFSMDLYARKGVLTDLYPYIDQDETMEREDFQENVLKAYETDNRLYGIPVYYWINTMAVAESATGETRQWNMDEMITFADSYMPESTVFSEANKTHILELCLMANGESLIDWTKEGEEFNRELFVKMLVFANQFVPDGNYSYDENLVQRIQDTKQLQIICHVNVMGFAEQQVYMGAFGEAVSYLGYPSEKGNGNLIDSNFVMAINSKCEDKETAWNFISSQLSEESQWDYCQIIGFPIRKSVMDKKIESEMEISYETDENGNQREKKRDTRALGEDRIDIYAAREEDVQKVLDTINNADKIRSWNEQIGNIIYEESKAFFDGSKSADQVADIVENRVRTYINEMK